jgi:hypothetical protein
MEDTMTKRHPYTSLRITFRMPETMHQRLKKEAKHNHQSLNTEIVHRLAATFGKEGIALMDQYEIAQAEIKEMVNLIVRSLGDHND